jgi:NADPH2:quinone reductase
LVSGRSGGRQRFRAIALIALFDLLHAHKIKPLIAQQLPLAEARHAHELLGEGGVTGKIVLMGRTNSRPSGTE